MASSSQRRYPLRVAYDISLMSRGGFNGGIKTHLLGFLRYLMDTRRHLFEFSVFCKEEMVPELGFLAANPYHHVHVVGPRGELDLRNTDGSLPPVRYWPKFPENLLQLLGCDLLYAGFGESLLSCSGVPQISLLVDTLHAERPNMLPKAEVERRHEMFRRVIEQATLVQTNSRHCAEMLIRHYDAPPEKVFHLYLPLHARFKSVEMAPPMRQLDGKKYFFYPANLWPHKNHETLLVAYRQYRHALGEEAWLLVLTGGDADPDRRSFLMQTRDTLGLQDSVLFLEHVNDSELKTIWELCSALVFPSLYEGFGLPLLEAMHFQKPVIAAPLATTVELLEGTFRPCEPTKPEDIARAMIELTREGVERAQYGDILHRYDLEGEAEKLANRMVSAVETSSVNS